MASFQWQRESTLGLLSDWAEPNVGKFREEGFVQVLVSTSEVDEEAENVGAVVWFASLR